MVLAVNAYNEPKSTIQSFVEREKLRQKILLEGRSVAAEKYLVRGFPTTFLIDRAGRIVHREVGFSAATAPGLQKRIEALVGDAASEAAR